MIVVVIVMVVIVMVVIVMVVVVVVEVVVIVGDGVYGACFYEDGDEVHGDGNPGLNINKSNSKTMT